MVGSAFGGFALDVSKIKAKLQTLTSGQSCNDINLIISTQFLGLVEYYFVQKAQSPLMIKFKCDETQIIFF